MNFDAFQTGSNDIIKTVKIKNRRNNNSQFQQIHIDQNFSISTVYNKKETDLNSEIIDQTKQHALKDIHNLTNNYPYIVFVDGIYNFNNNPYLCKLIFKKKENGVLSNIIYVFIVDYINVVIKDFKILFPKLFDKLNEYECTKFKIDNYIKEYPYPSETYVENHIFKMKPLTGNDSIFHAILSAISQEKIQEDTIRETYSKIKWFIQETSNNSKTHHLEFIECILNFGHNPHMCRLIYINHITNYLVECIIDYKNRLKTENIYQLSCEKEVTEVMERNYGGFIPVYFKNNTVYIENNKCIFSKTYDFGKSNTIGQKKYSDDFKWWTFDIAIIVAAIVFVIVLWLCMTFLNF